LEFKPPVVVGRFYTYADLTDAAMLFFERARHTLNARAEPGVQDELGVVRQQILTYRESADSPRLWVI